MVQNAYSFAKIGADTAENERTFAEICQILRNHPIRRAEDREEADEQEEVPEKSQAVAGSDRAGLNYEVDGKAGGCFSLRASTSSRE